MKSSAPNTAAAAINFFLPEFPALGAITTATTGIPGIAGINPSLLKSFRSYKYRTDAENIDQEFSSLKEINHVTKNLKSEYDLLFLDSWHTYEDSLGILEIGIRLAKPNSIILVHDCLSLSSSLSSDYVPGAWSGVTCFVFREFAKTLNREWFVLDSDYGVGVLGPEIKSIKPTLNSVSLELLKESELANFEQFYANPQKYMRGILPSDFHRAVNLIKSGKSPEPLVHRNAGQGIQSPTWETSSLSRRIRQTGRALLGRLGL